MSDLNERLDSLVQDYMYEETLEKQTKEKFRNDKISSTVFFETMRLIDSYKWTLIHQMYMVVHRMVRKDIDINNEVAISLISRIHDYPF